MNIPATLAKCRKEWEWQMAMEKNDIGAELPWSEISGDIEIWYHDYKAVTVADEPARVNMCLARNLNPARLRVVELQLATAERIYREVSPQEEYAPELLEVNLREAAALLGVEVEEAGRK